MSEEWDFGEPLETVREAELERRNLELLRRLFAPGGAAIGQDSAETARVNAEQQRIGRELRRRMASRPPVLPSLPFIGTSWVGRGTRYWLLRAVMALLFGFLALLFGGISGTVLYEAFHPGSGASHAWRFYLVLATPIAIGIGVVIGWATYGSGFGNGRYGGSKGFQGTRGPDVRWGWWAAIAMVPTLPLSLGAVTIGVFCATLGWYWPTEWEAREQFARDQALHQQYLRGEL